MTGIEKITVRPKLKGGSEKIAEETANEKTKQTSFICLNANGFPSDRNN